MSSIATTRSLLGASSVLRRDDASSLLFTATRHTRRFWTQLSAPRQCCCSGLSIFSIGGSALEPACHLLCKTRMSIHQSPNLKIDRPTFRPWLGSVKSAAESGALSPRLPQPQTTGAVLSIYLRWRTSTTRSSIGIVASLLC